MRISDWSSDVCSSDLNDMANRQFEFGIGFENPLRQPVQLHLQTDLRALRSTFSEYVDGILRAQLRCPVSFENPLTLDFNGSSNAYQRWRGGMGARTGLDSSEESRVGKESVSTL